MVPTWLISFEQIKRTNSLAANYLSLICCFDPRCIPLSLLPPAPLRTNQMNAIKTLNAYSFVRRQSATELLNMHPLVHLVMRNWLRREKSLDMWTDIAVARLEQVFPRNNRQNRSLLRRYLPHARFILGSCLSGAAGEWRLSLLWKFGMCVFSDGLFDEAENAFSEAMEIGKKLRGAEHPSTLRSTTSLASTYKKQGRWKQAEDLEMQVMETSIMVLGTRHPNTLASMANLALTYRNQGRWIQAKDLESQVINLGMRALGIEHPNMLKSTSGMILSYQNRGSNKGAGYLLMDVIRANLGVLDVEDSTTSRIMANLRSTYRDQSQLKEGESLKAFIDDYLNHYTHARSRRNGAGASQAGGKFKPDSAYTSRQTVDYTLKDDSDNETLYYIIFMLPGSKEILIRDFAKQLADDIHKFSSSSQTMEGFKFLPGLLETFGRKLHGESSRKTQREDSFFVQKYRRYISPALFPTVTNISVEKSYMFLHQFCLPSC